MPPTLWEMRRHARTHCEQERPAQPISVSPGTSRQLLERRRLSWRPELADFDNNSSGNHGSVAGKPPILAPRAARGGGPGRWLGGGDPVQRKGASKGPSLGGGWRLLAPSGRLLGAPRLHFRLLFGLLISSTNFGVTFCQFLGSGRPQKVEFSL